MEHLVIHTAVNNDVSTTPQIRYIYCILSINEHGMFRYYRPSSDMLHNKNCGTRQRMLCNTHEDGL